MAPSGVTVDECQGMIQRSLRTQPSPVNMLEEKGNHVRMQDEVNQAVIVGLIHAYDDCRAANLDLSDCAHHACTQDCVKRRVLKSMDGNPRCSKEESKDAMEAVWDICYNDTQPFDRAP